MARRNVDFALALTALCLLALLPWTAVAYDYSYARVVRLSLVEGDVQVARPDQQSWEQAVVNLPIQQGYSLATGGGRAEIEFESGATARVDDNSVLQFTELALSNGGRITKLTLTQGTATFYANLSREDSFVVATPHLQVVTPESARFRVDAANESTSVSVLKGEVEVDSSAGTNRLTKGHRLVYSSSDPDHVVIDRNTKADAWDHWVADRDGVVQKGDKASLRYVNSPYSYGMWDLYDYGNWYSLPGYGQCWQPYGLGLNWYPYWNGTWAFYPGLGWTWVSFEPWGWLPYHFGSWIFAPNLGWLWVPGSFNAWQPARVTWVRVGNQVGWVPIAPQDQPGQTPTNLQHGFVVTTPNRFIGTKPNERILMDPKQTAQMLSGPPTGFASATAPASGSTPSGTPPTRLSTGSRDQRGVIFDPKEHKFVNNPAGPQGVGAQRGVTPATPPARTTAPQGASPTGTPGSTAPTNRGRNVAPHQTTGPPPPHVQTPRSSQPTPPPPPKSERPSVRNESSHPTPHWESSPREVAPTPMPRSEPRAPAGSRPHN